MLIAMIESCFELLLPETLRMVVNACALVGAKIFYDEQVRTIDAARRLKVNVAQLKAAEHVVISVLLQTSHPSGHRIAPTAYARPLISSYETYSPACAAIMREIAASHVACSWRRMLAVRMRLARRAEHVAAQSATNKLAAKLAAAATTMQRAYRKAARAKTASPVSIMCWPSRMAPAAFEEEAFGLDSKDHNAPHGCEEGGGGKGGAGGCGESDGAGNGGGGTSGGCTGYRYGTVGGSMEAAAARAAARIAVIRAMPSPLVIEGPPPCHILLGRLSESILIPGSL